MLVVLLSVAGADARQFGITGQSVFGCSCHAVAADPTTTASFGAAPAVVLPGEAVPLTFTVSTTNALRLAGGLNVASPDGTFVAGSNTQVLLGEITHPSPQLMTLGAVTFDFEWTAPVAEGIYTLTAAGNAVNLNGFSTGDGWNFATSLVVEVDDPCNDEDLDGFDPCGGGDCDDTDPAVFPGATEVCDSLDNDCNLAIDDNASDATAYFPDGDLDGYGLDSGMVLACTAPFGHVTQGGDCDDTRATINPGEPEVCDPFDADQDCDGLADDETATDAVAWYTDADGDGYGTGAPTIDCEQPPGTSSLDGDCDDTNVAFNPGAPETDCSDPTDYNCDLSTGFSDADGDGFAACLECDDSDAGNNPSATEVCDGDDDDCDGTVDEPDAADAATWYRDDDLDGHGVPTDSVVACTAPAGYAPVDDDCNDNNGGVNPDVAETWYDGIDQNCDGNDDDQDLDGVASPADCRDTDPDVHPGAADAPYDGIDSDCAGNDDFDADGDGYPAEIGGGDDCNDQDAGMNPGVQDPPCDGVDLDCDPIPDGADDCGEPTTPTDGTPTDGTTPPDQQKLGGCSCGSAGDAPAGSLLLGLLLALTARRRAS